MIAHTIIPYGLIPWDFLWVEKRRLKDSRWNDYNKNNITVVFRTKWN